MAVLPRRIWSRNKWMMATGSSRQVRQECLTWRQASRICGRSSCWAGAFWSRRRMLTIRCCMRSSCLVVRIILLQQENDGKRLQQGASMGIIGPLWRGTPMGAVKMNDPAGLGQDLLSLLSLFPTPHLSDIMNYEIVKPCEVSPPYHDLLVHNHHMT